MKIATLLILVSTSLAGCIVAPLGGPPGVYVAPIAPAIVIRPYGYYGGTRYRGWR
jgi:hypothetical protein